MKKYNFLTLTFFAAIALVSCSNDDNGGDDGQMANLESQVYATSNTDGNVRRYDNDDSGNTTTTTLITLSTDSEGIYYDQSTDQVTQASRSLLQLNTYADASITPDGVTVEITASSSIDLVSPRDIAVNGNVYVVADNADVDGDPNTADGRLFVYTKSGSTFTLRNTVTVDFAVWGIEFVGNDLYAVVDKTSDIAVFTNFAATNTTDTTVAATKRITIEGIVRTHGIAFDGGTMILTDVGDASSDIDGAFHVITDFETKFNAVADGGTMAVAGNQIRVSGALTLLGNPVSADFDSTTNTVYIAERANGGGRVLSFTDIGTGGNVGPTLNATLSGASSVYFTR